MRKYDFFLIAVLIVCFVLLPIFNGISKSTGNVANVYVDKELEISFNLDEYGEFLVESEYGSNKLVVDSNGICIIDSDCKNKDCMYFGSINKEGQFIACIPHHLLVEIQTSDNVYDSVAY